MAQVGVAKEFGTAPPFLMGELWNMRRWGPSDTFFVRLITLTAAKGFYSLSACVISVTGKAFFAFEKSAAYSLNVVITAIRCGYTWTFTSFVALSCLVKIGRRKEVRWGRGGSNGGAKTSQVPPCSKEESKVLHRVPKDNSSNSGKFSPQWRMIQATLTTP